MNYHHTQFQVNIIQNKKVTKLLEPWKQCLLKNRQHQINIYFNDNEGELSQLWPGWLAAAMQVNTLPGLTATICYDWTSMMSKHIIITSRLKVIMTITTYVNQ